MPINNLESLPLDVHYNISSTLDLDSFVNLSRVTRQLHSLFLEESICRRCIKEAELAQRSSGQSISYRQALSRLSDIREAYKTARPYSCSILAHGAAFLYKQGVLCYLESSQVRFLQVHDWSREEQVIDIRTLVDHATTKAANHDHSQITLLHYQDDIFTFLYEADNSFGGSWLIAIDRRVTPPRSPLKLARRLGASARLFVRQNGSYLYYGTHTGISTEHNHREWVIEGINLETGERYPPLQLGRFVGSDLGLTVCFEIYNGYFYALSNQTSFDVEEIDWTSYYNCVRFPVADPSTVQRDDRIWRRQHIEGPINDTWTDLSLHLDESTNKVVIVECRREWKDGGSTSMRTFYNEPLPFDEDYVPTSCSEDSSHPAVVDGTLPDDILTTQIDDTNKPNYTPARKRPPERYHPEYPDTISENREFILAKTKHRTYNLSCFAFLDLVNDPLNIPFSAPRDRLRLRIGHRKLGSPMELDEQNRYVMRGEAELHDQGIQLWPPDDAPKELLEILCPNRTIGQVDAASDERSVVYMTGPSYSKTRAIVIINFDPTVSKVLGFKDSPLKRLYLPDPPDPSSTWKGKMVEVDVERMRCGEIRGEQRRVAMEPAGPPSVTSSNVAVPYFRSERARYLDIKKGVWLRKPLAFQHAGQTEL